MTVALALHRCGGVARTAQLLAAGVAEREIRDAVAGCMIHRVRRGVFALDSDSELARAAAHGGSVACVSALALRGVFVLRETSDLHVRLGRAGRHYAHADCSCISHLDRGSSRFGVASVRDALVQATKCLSPESFFASFESAWFRSLISARDRAYIRGHVTARFRRVIDIAQGRSESGLESITRFRLIAAGFSVESQVVIRGVGRVDFVIGRLIIEVDGRLGHEGTARHKDLERDRVAAIAGYRTLRFTYAQVIHQWLGVLAAIKVALGQ